jgi:hypothetical protein
MNDELRLVSQLSGDTYKNSTGSEIAIVKIENSVLMTTKEIAKLYGVSRAYIAQVLGRFWKSGEFNKKVSSCVLPHQANDGKLYETRYYNQKIIAAVGRFVKTDEAEHFKNWLSGGKAKLIS